MPTVKGQINLGFSIPLLCPCFLNAGAVAFRHNRIKNRGIVKNTIPLHKKSIFEGNEVENLRFSSILNETAPIILLAKNNFA